MTDTPEKALSHFREHPQYATAILDALSAHVAIIDENGIIQDTNLAWKTFGLSNEIQMAPDTVGVNYLSVCDSALGKDAQRSREVSRGIRRVINGDIPEFVIEYPCHSPEREFWFYMRATRVKGMDPVRVVISHENITPLKLAEKALAEESVNLAEANAALKVILRQREEDREKMARSIYQNIQEDILPLAARLRTRIKNPDALELLNLITGGLEEIASPLIRRLSSLETVLTPREIQIARLIKAGKSTKEIAEVLGLSGTTISFHRRNIRKKLGLDHTRTNLRTHLLSLSI